MLMFKYDVDVLDDFNSLSLEKDPSHATQYSSSGVRYTYRKQVRKDERNKRRIVKERRKEKKRGGGKERIDCIPLDVTIEDEVGDDALDLVDVDGGLAEPLHRHNHLRQRHRQVWVPSNQPAASKSLVRRDGHLRRERAREGDREGEREGGRKEVAYIFLIRFL